MKKYKITEIAHQVTVLMHRGYKVNISIDSSTIDIPRLEMLSTRKTGIIRRIFKREKPSYCSSLVDAGDSVLVPFCLEDILPNTLVYDHLLYCIGRHAVITYFWGEKNVRKHANIFEKLTAIPVESNKEANTATEEIISLPFGWRAIISRSEYNASEIQLL